MGKRQNAWAKQARLALIVELGAWCRCCNADNIDCLTIEHVNGKLWDSRRVGFSWRVSIMRREAREGKLTVLCFDCNSQQGGRRRYRYRRVPENGKWVRHEPIMLPPVTSDIPF